MPLAYNATCPDWIFLSSMVIRMRSMSDLAHTVSWDRLPHRMAASTERSTFTCSTKASSASLNDWWTEQLSPDLVRDVTGKYPTLNSSSRKHENTKLEYQNQIN